jgi:N-acetylglucosaminyl-diphospho-decaprenol L-rhamnosyltransferase
MKICAIILDYRGASKTLACLQSLVSEGIDTVLVVDNSGNVQASEQLSDAIVRLKEQGIDYALNVLTPVENLGFGRGVNFALNDIAAQRCDAILLLNNDASMTSGSLAKMSDALSAGDADLIAPAIIDDHDIPQPMLWYQRFFGLLTDHALPGSFPYLSGCGLLFRRDLPVSGKLFDESFFMYGEDTLLGWKMARQKKTILRLNTAVVRHTGQDSTRPCTLFYEYHMARAHILLALKTWRSPLEIPLLLATKSMGLALRAMLRCFRYKSGIPLLAFFLAWLPISMRKS